MLLGCYQVFHYLPRFTLIFIFLCISVLIPILRNWMYINRVKLWNHIWSKMNYPEIVGDGVLKQDIEKRRWDISMKTPRFNITIS